MNENIITMLMMTGLELVYRWMLSEEKKPEKYKIVIGVIVDMGWLLSIVDLMIFA